MKKLIALSLAVLLSGTAAAAEGGYAGFDVGQGKLSDLNLKGSGWNLYGGYRLNNNFGFEAGYRRVLSDDVIVGNKVKVTIGGLQISALGYLPLSDDFALFARLGVNNLKIKASGPIGKVSEDETKALVGLGMDYSFSKAIALRVEYQKPASDVSLLSAGLKFSF